MNSFTLTAVGQLARNPELVAKGSTAYTRFCLVGNDYAGKDDEGSAREVVTTLWFVAFGALGEAIARNSRKGDQLVVEARVRASNWTDKQGEKQYDHSFVVQGFRFGAPGRTKREERGPRREDGHGLHRNEAPPNGYDRSANNGAGAGGSANGAGGNGSANGARHAGTAPDARATRVAAARGPVGETRDPIDTGEPADDNEPDAPHGSVGTDGPAGPNDEADTNSDPTPTADTNVVAATAVGQTGIGSVGVDEAGGAGDGEKPVASTATKERSRRVANAGVTATRASEKSTGSRSGRRAATSVA